MHTRSILLRYSSLVGADLQRAHKRVSAIERLHLEWLQRGAQRASGLRRQLLAAWRGRPWLRLRGIVAVLRQEGAEEATANVQSLWGGYLGVSRDQKPVDYDVCYPQVLIDSLAQRTIRG
jgi:hypothetical protein